ncbi:MAG: ECF transporter S component [Oscillospiraceae bacterium]|nr:ECF transporter S component [Oscillospiraceae bacterium]
MPKRRITVNILTAAVIASVCAYTFANPQSVNYTLASTAVCLLILSDLFSGFENRSTRAKDVMPVAVMCTCASAGRVLFSFIPQIQPVTVIIMVMGVCFGGYTGFITGALSALISNMILGQGPWTIWQMLGWGMTGLICGMLKNRKISDNIFFMAVLSFVMAFIYGLITDTWTISFISQDGLSTGLILGVYSASMLFNFIHGAGNIVFCLLLYKPLKAKLIRIRNKYGVNE